MLGSEYIGRHASRKKAGVVEIHEWGHRSNARAELLSAMDNWQLAPKRIPISATFDHIWSAARCIRGREITHLGRQLFLHERFSVKAWSP